VTGLVALALAALGAQPAGVPGKTGPVRVDAAEVKYLYPKRQAIFSGAPVRLTRDDAVLTCRRLVATNDEAGRIVRAVCSGDVHLTRGPRVVSCDTAVYEDAAARVTCDGSPVVLKDGETEARGERLVYDLGTDEVTLGKASAQSGSSVVITAPGDEIEQRQKELEQRRGKAPAVQAVPPAKEHRP